jgi:glutaredoxin
VFAVLFRWLRDRSRRERPALPVTVYSRAGCHLCDEALAVLRRYEEAYRLHVAVVDIDRDPDLAARYGDRVPVVVIGGRERFFGRVNEALLRRLLAAEVG